MEELREEAQRRQAIAWAIALATDTPLEPDQYELDLLEQYAQGAFTLDQVLGKLDTRISHILYHSRATRLLTSAQLTDLVEESKQWNMQHGITGLLCYSSDGHFVQILEGAASDITALFARIRKDPRHQQVIPLSESKKASDKRWFADWRMALVQLESHDFFWLIDYLEAREHNLVQPRIPVLDPLVINLLELFSKT